MDKTYSKSDIIKEALKKEIFQIEHEDTTFKMKLNKVIDELRNNYRIDLQDENRNDFEISYYNLDYETNKPYKPYKYNTPTYILIMLALERYHDLKFKKALQGDNITTDEGEEIFEKIELFFNSNYSKLLEEYCKNNNKKYYIVKFNMMNLFYNILVNTDFIEEDKIDNVILDSVIMMLALPEKQKKEMYNGQIINRLKYIRTEIENEYKYNLDPADKKIFDLKSKILREELEKIIY